MFFLGQRFVRSDSLYNLLFKVTLRSVAKPLPSFKRRDVTNFALFYRGLDVYRIVQCNVCL